MLTDVLQKELCKHFRAEFCTLTWNSLLLKMNLDSFFCVTEMASFVFRFGIKVLQLFDLAEPLSANRAAIILKQNSNRFFF